VDVPYGIRLIMQRACAPQRELYVESAALQLSTHRAIKDYSFSGLKKFF